jgi:serine/threonine protein kinase
VWENVKGHPNILPIIKADIFGGQIYIASEYAPDGSLSEWLKKHDGKAPAVETAVQMVKGILAGLEHLHSKGVIHRDLKPANILLQSDTPRIADFGIARLAKSDATNSALSAGTPSYMAPECFYSVRSEQTDIWAVGVLFHKLLSGKLPFSQPDQISVMNAVLNGEPEIDQEIPEQLRQIIRKALQKDTAQRYQSAAEMRQALNNFNPAILADEDTLLEPPMPIEPRFEKEEEETVISRRPPAIQSATAAVTAGTTPAAAAVPAPILYQEIDQPAGSGNRKTFAIALGSLLILAAVTAWAAFQFGGEEQPTTQTGFTDSSNTGNLNSNLTNAKAPAGNLANFGRTTDEKRNPGNSSANTNTEPALSGIGEPQQIGRDGNTSAPPYNIQRDELEPPPPAGGRLRTTRTEATPAEENTDDAPPAPKTPAPTPIELTPLPPGRQRVPRSTPRPAEKPEETPPPIEKNDSRENR